MDKKQTKKNKHEEIKKKPENELYGMDPEMSLQSVNFAPNENSYLNEHFQKEADE